MGVVRVFEKVRDKKDCTLVLLGSLASDDPEGLGIQEKVMERVVKSKYKDDMKILLIENDVLANCLQRASSVVIQKSLKEGFSLTVSEALYKGTPVVASKTGGIPLQVIDGKNGFLDHPLDTIGFSKSIIRIMENDLLRKEMGANGK
ncbi:MAG: glycosyltransferase [Candidatus Altiarchaeia archaeon]